MSIYIYLKYSTDKFENKEVYKLGITHNLYKRFHTYNTNEVNGCKFKLLIKFNHLTDNINEEKFNIEKIYQDNYSNINVNNNIGGKEFYYSNIFDTIKDFTFKTFNNYKFIIFDNKENIINEIFNSYNNNKNNNYLNIILFIMNNINDKMIDIYKKYIKETNDINIKLNIFEEIYNYLKK